MMQNKRKRDSTRQDGTHRSKKNEAKQYATNQSSRQNDTRFSDMNETKQSKASSTNQTT